MRPGPNEQLYKLKSGFRFHLYINTAPCGDARIFSPHEDDMAVDKHPNRYNCLFKKKKKEPVEPDIQNLTGKHCKF